MNIVPNGTGVSGFGVGGDRATNMMSGKDEGLLWDEDIQNFGVGIEMRR